VAKEGAGEFAEFAGLRAGEPGELAASFAADQAVLQRDTAACVGAFEQARDVGEEGGHERMKGGGSSRCR